ncbi:T9SS type A sorting domain-containing protein [Panacibacter sp. DH6]|uniref:T9SS type A sorting domain-containing protein n=1 Tax=Panacibacter microcysteis TaxID=2793269 RepID=A0A931MD73_9BACT|nr:T9SS type A sorting domain-containing protein [Panacibacter microcysteis]MBG9378516.1 T9SS type A sorting domain-containing protein [Panacibacter microcysteis]
MKRILLLLFMVVAYNSLFASVSQGHWRWRKDDGSEITATWMADQDQPATISDASQNIRLRIELYNDDVNSNDPDNEVLQYTISGGSDWKTITTDAGTNAFVLASTSPNVTDLEPTTQQITGANFPFESGKVIVSTSPLPSLPVSPYSETEYEFCIKPTANIAPSTTYEFRVQETNHNAGYTNPVLTTAATLPVTFTGFSLLEKNNGIQVSWTTGTEINNDHFVVQRSTDANTWKNVSTVTANKTGSYSYFDAAPLSGKSYYRIMQFDRDGKSSATSVKYVELGKGKMILTVTPNPVVDNINLVVKNYEGNVVVTVRGSDGRTAIKQTVNIAANGSAISIPVRGKVTPGLYYVSVTGSGLKATTSVLIK